MKNIDMVNYFNGVQTLREKKIPMKLAYSVAVNIKRMVPYLEAFEEARAKAGTQEEVNELLMEDVSLDLIPITLKDYDTEKYDLLTVNELNALLMTEEQDA